MSLCCPTVRRIPGPAATAAEPGVIRTVGGALRRRPVARAGDGFGGPFPHSATSERARRRVRPFGVSARPRRTQPRNLPPPPDRPAERPRIHPPACARPRGGG